MHNRFVSALIIGASSITATAQLLSPSQAQAQDGPQGIVFVQAPEQSSGVGVANNIGVAISQAIAQCVAGGALASDCIVTDWCMPAGWSVDFFVQHAEGLHWHETHCGLPDEASARAMEAIACDAALRPWITDCALVELYDPQGTRQMAE